jgi:protein KRI1
VIKSYPRHLSSLVRREDTSRKEARERKKQRKAEELLKKKEEVKLLKKLKMKDINARLERIGREGGKDLENNPGKASSSKFRFQLIFMEVLQSLDLDGEWDPVVHDRQMAELYENVDADDEKPHWDEDIGIDDIIPVQTEPSQKSTRKKKKKKKDGEGELGVDIDAMDADVNRQVDDEEWDGTEEMRKKRLDEYMDEIYGLDFNDMVCVLKAWKRPS